MVTLRNVIGAVQTKYNDLATGTATLAKEVRTQYDGSRVQKFIHLTQHQISENRKPIAGVIGAVSIVAAYQFGLLALYKTAPAHSGFFGAWNRIAANSLQITETTPSLLGSIVLPVVDAARHAKDAIINGAIITKDAAADVANKIQTQANTFFFPANTTNTTVANITNTTAANVTNATAANVTNPVVVPVLSAVDPLAKHSKALVDVTEQLAKDFKALEESFKAVRSFKFADGMSS